MPCLRGRKVQQPRCYGVHRLRGHGGLGEQEQQAQQRDQELLRVLRSWRVREHRHPRVRHLPTWGVQCGRRKQLRAVRSWVDVPAGGGEVVLPRVHVVRGRKVRGKRKETNPSVANSLRRYRTKDCTATSDSECAACAPGKASTGGETECNVCGSGEYAEEGAGFCSTVRAG